MSDIELAISSCKRLEGLLEQSFGASGRGLHEKVTSVKEKIPEPLIKKLRFIATLRNKLIHEVNVASIDDRSGFERACNEAEQALRELSQPAQASKTGCLVILVTLSSLTSSAVALLLMIVA